MTEFQESLGMPSSDLTFHSKREEREPNSTTVTGQFIFFLHTGLKKCKNYNHTEYDLKINWHVS